MLTWKNLANSKCGKIGRLGNVVAADRRVVRQGALAGQAGSQAGVSACAIKGRADYVSAKISPNVLERAPGLYVRWASSMGTNN